MIEERKQGSYIWLNSNQIVTKIYEPSRRCTMNEEWTVSIWKDKVHSKKKKALFIIPMKTKRKSLFTEVFSWLLSDCEAAPLLYLHCNYDAFLLRLTLFFFVHLFLFPVLANGYSVYFSLPLVCITSGWLVRVGAGSGRSGSTSLFYCSCFYTLYFVEFMDNQNIVSLHQTHLNNCRYMFEFEPNSEFYCFLQIFFGNVFEILCFFSTEFSHSYFFHHIFIIRYLYGSFIDKFQWNVDSIYLFSWVGSVEKLVRVRTEYFQAWRVT